MGALKNIFTLKKKDETIPVATETEDLRDQIRITYYQSGYGASSKAFGDPLTFGVGLHNLYNSLRINAENSLMNN